jgi:hypothetical protein
VLNFQASFYLYGQSVSHHLHSVWEIWLKENLCERRKRAGEHKGVVYTKWGWCPLLKGYRQDADECRRDGYNNLTSTVTAADWSFVKTLFRLWGFVQCRMICDGSQECWNRASRLCRCTSCLVFGWFSVRIVTGTTEFSVVFVIFVDVFWQTPRWWLSPRLLPSQLFPVHLLPYTNNTKYSKYKYTYYRNTHTLQNPHIHNRTLQNKLRRPQYKIPNEIVTIQSSTLSIRPPPMYMGLLSPRFTATPLHFTSLQNKITSHKSRQFTSYHFTYLHLFTSFYWCKKDGQSLQNVCFLFHVHTVLLHLDTIKFFYSPTDAQVNCLKNNFKIYIKIYIKTAPTCFGAITIMRERTIRSC